ncbi:MAG: efflux RND transporter periplasmic adaptor subunit [Bacteroidota bacterium]|jgi:cobalt-zinc-cadmium efflux system membrane fusion protein
MKYIVTILTTVVLLSACGNKENNANTPAKKDYDSIALTQQQLKGVNVTFVQFTQRLIKPIIHANGAIRLLPESKAEVSSHINGKIDRIFVREGMYVNKNQALLSISSFDLLELQNEYVSAKNEAEFQRVEFERQGELKKRNMGVLADYQAAKAKYQSAIIKEKTLQQKLEMLGIDTRAFADLTNPHIQKTITIKAPFSGYMNKLNVHAGSLVQPETILAEIIDPKQLQAEVYVYEKDAELIKEGLPVTLNFVQNGIAPVQGKVLFVSRALDPTNKTITLHVQFAQPQHEEIHADMNVKAVITGQAGSVAEMAIPATTLYDDGEHKYIFVAMNPKNEKVQMKKFRVEVLKEDEGYAVIKSIQKLPKDCWIADYNVLAIEAERKKNE